MHPDRITIAARPHHATINRPPFAAAIDVKGVPSQLATAAGGPQPSGPPRDEADGLHMQNMAVVWHATATLHLAQLQ